MNIPAQQNGVSPPNYRSAELHRLNLQGHFFADLTEHVFQ